MIRYVIDASAAVEFLLRTPLGLEVADMIDGARILAPELLDVEVLSVLRRAVRCQKLDEFRARCALDDLVLWPIDRIAHTNLLQEAWQFRDNTSAYDAMYVAAARVFQACLLTADGPLARAPALGIVVQNIRMG